MHTCSGTTLLLRVASAKGSGSSWTSRSQEPFFGWWFGSGELGGRMACARHLPSTTTDSFGAFRVKNSASTTDGKSHPNDENKCL